MRKPENMSREELLEARARIDRVLAMMDSGLTPKPRRSRGIRHQPRDWRIYHHLGRARKLSTEQVADLEFPDEYGQPRERAARSRLYLLKKEGSYLTNRTDLKGVGTAWELTREGFRVMRESPSEAYPAPLDPDRARHLIATNDVYVELVRMLRGLPGIEDADWRWVPEPECHRRYDVPLEARRQRRSGAGVGRLLKPDAEVVLFEEVVFFIERQTAWAKKKPEILHDKVFGYHRYENSAERRSDPRRTLLFWACDLERDGLAVLEAADEHPTKSLRDLRMDERDTKRMPLAVGPPWWIAQQIRGETSEVSRRRASS